MNGLADPFWANFERFLVVLWPPFEKGVRSDLIQIVCKDTATFSENLIKFIQRLEVFIDDGLIRQRPQAFGGLDLWRVRWQEHQFNAFRNFQILGDMPARAVEHQDDLLVEAGANFGGERPQERAEQRSVDAVGDEPHDLAGGGPDEAVQIKPLVAVMATGDGAAAARRPDRIGFRPRRCSSNAQTSTGQAASVP